MNIPRYLGRKLDDSLPDFVTFVVSRFWNWGKRDNNPHFIVTKIREFFDSTRTARGYQ
ncbi:TPA: hypothetical protein MOX26_003615 [Salmonella enterica subsp. enterica serovar Ball]|uniref:hypothetical protein n=1 Tax=Salmonella enterica TaxID=28901 RepID=UPI001C45D8AE|nr:hypothetical protein [Salmonella enterica]EJU7772625.1 hypothetical protein [Salmonella enterica subsp. salamae serovar 4,12:e,n,x:1,6]EKR2075120.1 hypothetical protein [Salmonella enterica subsp. salamae serovar 9,46:l,w:e,n,x]HCA3434280.1 hypothetical protein [Salmonella enterica subsp. enterica serovar Ball]EIP3950381.1 hypothetical protein [Salmonella enterica]EKN4990614.1 hypothetical protein [Salmonella enterica]